MWLYEIQVYSVNSSDEYLCSLIYFSMPHTGLTLEGDSGEEVAL